MHSAPSPTTRREFLRGGVALVSASTLGLLPSLVQASTTASAPPTLGFWNGSRFVPVDSLAPVAAPSERVRLTLTSEGGGGFAALDAHAPHPSLGRVPFVLWVAPPAGTPRTRSLVTTEADGGLVLAAHAKDGTRTEVRLSGSKLREGTHLLVAGPVDWKSLGMNEEGKVVHFRAMVPHVRIDVERV